MGGAKNCPETPRQKMIGMMYLVLTAMLALNVSANILDGFKKITDSMNASIKATSERTGGIMSAFKESAGKEEGAKYREWLTIANAVQTKSDELYNYLETFKNDLVALGGGWQEEDGVKSLANPGDLNAASEFVKGHGNELHKKLNEFSTYMTSADSPCLKRKMSDKRFKMEWDSKMMMYKTMFNTDDVVDQDGVKRSWESSIFDEQPLASAVAMIAKYQNDIKIAENDMVNFLFQQGGVGDFSFNKVEAVILGDEGYYAAGSSHKVKICTAALDSTHTPEVYVNGTLIPNGEYSVGGGAGEHTYSGYIQVDEATRLPFTGHYTVFQPSSGGAAIANTDMNIVYQGWPHKFTVSAPGVQASKLRVSCSGGSCSGSNGQYTITASGSPGSTMTISVSGEVEGKVSNFGSMTYRIKPKPPVIVKVTAGGGTVKKMPKNALGSCSLSAAYAGDLLQSNFSVSGFTWECDGQSGKASSLSDGALGAAVRGARRGDVLALSDFRISGSPAIANPSIAITLQ